MRALCLLLDQLLSVEGGGRRQGVLISLAVGVQLVQRLWFSHLRAAHATGAWVTAGTRFQGPAPLACMHPWALTSRHALLKDASVWAGWMAPLALPSHATNMERIQNHLNVVYEQVTA